jgi:hypothetical protein
MRVIHKFEVFHGRKTRIFLPMDATVRYVGIQDNKICMWIEYDTSLLQAGRLFKIFPTGVDVTPYYMYCGSVITSDCFVWHVYEVPV